MSADPKERALTGIAEMIEPSLAALLDCVRGENVKDGSKARNHQTRLLASKYVLDVVLDRMPDAQSVEQQQQMQRLTPEAAVLELRKRLGAK